VKVGTGQQAREDKVRDRVKVGGFTIDSRAEVETIGSATHAEDKMAVAASSPPLRAQPKM
jgi:hypothetical protein